jgi:glycosyltransferase involved in cell wall biosynthesis
MRIAQVLFSLDMGGQEIMALHLSKELMRRGHDLTVVSMTPGGTLRSEFAPAEVVDAPRKAGTGIDPNAWPTLFRAFRQICPDVVHTHAPGPLLYAVPAARLAGVKRVVHTSHGANVTQHTSRSIALGRVIARLLTRFVPVSDETALTARSREKVPDALIQVIPNGIPLDRYSPDAAKRSRVRAELGIPDLIGPRRDVPDVLTAFDVFTLTSTTEGLPLAVPEAMASELPVVATAVGSLPTIVPKETGILVPSGDEAGLTAAYKRLLDNPRARREMAKAARSFAHARFSLAKMVDAYERIYREG